MILIQQALLHCFPIDELVMIERLELGPFSHGWLVEVKRQGLKERWFVKRHRAKPEERLAFELRAADRLRARGLDLIPPVIPTMDGNLWFSTQEGNYNYNYSAQTFIEADPPYDWMTGGPMDDERVRLAGAALARFHQACLSLPTDLPPQWQQQCTPWLPQLRAASRDVLMRTQQELPANEPIRELVISHADRLQANLEIALSTAAASKCEPLLIHGDYHPGNVLFRDAKVVAILDFDYIQLGCPAYDVAYAAYMFGRDWHSQKNADGCLAPFVAGYEQYASQSPSGIEDFQMLPPFLVGYWLLVQYLEQPPLRPAIEPVLRAALQDAAAIIENPLLRL